MIIEGRKLCADDGKYLHNKVEDLYFLPGSYVYLGIRDSISNYEDVSVEVAEEAIATKREANDADNTESV